MHEPKSGAPVSGDSEAEAPAADVEAAGLQAASAETAAPADAGADNTGEPHIADEAVLEALRELGTLDDLPVHEHADVVERVHRALQDRLSEPE